MQAIKRQATKALATKRQANGNPRKLKSNTKTEDIQKCYGESEVKGVKGVKGKHRPKNKVTDQLTKHRYTQKNRWEKGKGRRVNM